MNLDPAKRENYKKIDDLISHEVSMGIRKVHNFITRQSMNYMNMPPIFNQAVQLYLANLPLDAEQAQEIANAFKELDDSYAKICHDHGINP